MAAARGVSSGNNEKRGGDAAAQRRGAAASLIGVVRQAWEVSDAVLWISGGDAPVLAQGLKEKSIPFQHDPDLVLKGLVTSS